MATVDHRMLRNISLDSTNVDDEDDELILNNNHVCTHVPRDRFNSVYASLVLAGIGFLLPYNSFITAVDYFHSQYPGSTIVFDMSLTYIVIAFAAVLLNNLLVETLSFTFRISFGYVVAFFSLIMIAIFEIGLSMFSDGTSYVIVLIAVAIVSFGCTGMLPRKYTQAVMTGESKIIGLNCLIIIGIFIFQRQFANTEVLLDLMSQSIVVAAGAAGLITSLIRITTKLVLHNERINTLLFFIFSSIVILVCFVTYHTSRNSDFVRYHVAICSKDSRPTTDGFQVMTDEEQLVNDAVTDGGTMINAGGGDDDGDGGLDVDGNRYRYVKFNGKNSFELEYEQPASHNTKCNSIKMSILKRYRLARSVWPYMLSIALAYFVTLCLFPGIESEVINCSLGDWMPIIIMAIFNATDLIGKLLAAIPYAWKPKYLLIAASSRAVLIPLMILCVVPRRAPTLSSSVWAMIFSALLGVTNGYFGSLPMIIAPTTVPDEKRELTGNIMTISYNVGLTSGSAFAYFFRDLIGPAVNLCTSTYLIKKLPV